ncbi:MAG: hypothetical protein C4K49_04795 [Candidatus Thorarchaeota archaeon]|nr:MAG: hypothetical protein C4K49_04795 [Candidatus Thorarchaeota archaeon]
MSVNRATVSRCFVLLVLLLTALVQVTPVVEGTAVHDRVTTKVTDALAHAAASSQSGELIPVVAYFDDGTGAEEMLNAIQDIASEGYTVRHAFHLIPVVSLLATSDAVKALAQSDVIRTLGLDTKRSAMPLTLPSSEEPVWARLDYESPQEVLSADDLWSQGYNGTGVTVAVIDSGVQSTHPDLQGRLIGFRDFVNGLNDMDPSDGITSYDDNGHGTATAWLVAGTGVASAGLLKGMAPGADLLIVKVLDDTGSATDSAIATGIEFAVDNGADIISMSIGGSWTDTGISDPSIIASHAAVEEGVVVVVAAGNDGPAPFSINAPGVVEDVITVGASAGSLAVTDFSSRGPVERTHLQPIGLHAKPDIVAPGLRVVSGRAASASTTEYPFYNYTQYGGNYAEWSGTSASAPQIAGILALLMDKYAVITPIEMKAFLMAGATDLGEDPMAQGWGLANVSKSSELIANSSGIITLMTPRAFPTLPGTSSVFIIGDVREEQRVGVLSTTNLGHVTIAVTGNASDLVNTSVVELDVGTGYSYFGINLDIPEDLPISGVGRYIGQISLISGNVTVASMKLDLSITSYGGGLLSDQAHQSTADPDDPSYYRYFTQYLREQGIRVSVFGSPGGDGTIDKGALSSAEIFMIMDTEITYAQSEIDAIHNFVVEGGTLLMFSEFYNQTSGAASFAIDSYNEILAPYGIECESIGIGVGPNGLGLVYGTDYGGSVEISPITDGVRNLYILAGSTLKVEPSVAGAQGLLWIDEAKTHAIVATAEYGLGKVIVVSDGSILYDDVLYDADRAGADNLKLQENIAKVIVPVIPRVYDVLFSHGRIGETANITAYVFDEDLANVEITVRSSDGTNTTGVVTESLGYKFQMAFTLTSGGFYDIIVVARDGSGNMRLYEKMVLVPVDAADDVLVQAVVIGLLAIVVVGIIYVGALKIGSGKKASRRPDEEWEVPVGDGGPPPVIE